LVLVMGWDRRSELPKKKAPFIINISEEERFTQ